MAAKSMLPLVAITRNYPSPISVLLIQDPTDFQMSVRDLRLRKYGGFLVRRDELGVVKCEIMRVAVTNNLQFREVTSLVRTANTVPGFKDVFDMASD